jgi:hypothetical protein
LRIDIPECQALFIFKNNVCGDLFVDDFLKDVGLHHGIGLLSVVNCSSPSVMLPG